MAPTENIVDMYIDSWGIAAVQILLIPFCLWLFSLFSTKYYVKYKGIETKAIITNKHSKVVASNDGEETVRFWDIQYALKYDDKYYLYKYEYKFQGCYIDQIWDKYDVNDIVVMKYKASHDRKNQNIEFHKWHQSKDLLNNSCILLANNILQIIMALVVFLGILSFYFIIIYWHGIIGLGFVIINQTIGILFMRYILIPFLYHFFIFGIFISICECECNSWSEIWDSYKKDPFWCNRFKDKRYDGEIDEDEYNAFMRKIKNDSDDE